MLISSNFPSAGRGPPSASWLFFLDLLTGALYGARASIAVSQGFSGSSGKGARHLIRDAFFIQPCISHKNTNSYYH